MKRVRTIPAGSRRPGHQRRQAGYRNRIAGLLGFPAILPDDGWLI